MINNKTLISVLRDINEEIQTKKEYLTDLDNKIGDGDHGINMSRGFGFINENLDELKDKSVKQIFSMIGTKLMSKVGGASGPLYAMVFLKGSTFMTDDDVLTIDNFQQFVEDASQVIIRLGRAQIGDKTMLDVWKPLANELKHTHDKAKLLQLIVDQANSTIDKMALRGRASFLKERSIGTMDPGCASSEIILRHLIKAL